MKQITIKSAFPTYDAASLHTMTQNVVRIYPDNFGIDIRVEAVGSILSTTGVGAIQGENQNPIRPYVAEQAPYIDIGTLLVLTNTNASKQDFRSLYQDLMSTWQYYSVFLGGVWTELCFGSSKVRQNNFDNPLSVLAPLSIDFLIFNPKITYK